MQKFLHFLQWAWEVREKALAKNGMITLFFLTFSLFFASAL